MKPRRLLLVEDDSSSAEMLARRLRKRGYEVSVVGDGFAAVEAVRQDKPDLVLMDMNLPGLDGWSATVLIRENAETANLPVLAITAHSMSGDEERARAAGSSGYHAKPVDLEKLIEQIEFLLRGRDG